MPCYQTRHDCPSAKSTATIGKAEPEPTKGGAAAEKRSELR